MGQEHVSIISPAVPIKPTSNIPAYPIYGGAPVHPTAYSYTPPSTNGFIELQQSLLELNRHTAKIMKEIPEFMNRPDSPNLMGQEHFRCFPDACETNKRVPASTERWGSRASTAHSYTLSGGASVMIDQLHTGKCSIYKNI